MNSFIDYYEVLGVDSHASASTIKAAFKKLALKYHPDVYKGSDAQERMRDLLIAYQTLSDPISSNVVTWQSATGCAAGPKSTWGQIRALMH